MLIQLRHTVNNNPASTVPIKYKIRQKMARLLVVCEFVVYLMVFHVCLSSDNRYPRSSDEDSSESEESSESSEDLDQISGCGATPSVSNGVFGSMNVAYSVGDTAELVCNSGYTRNTAFIAEATITCQENGEWDTSTAYCVESCNSTGTSFMLGFFRVTAPSSPTLLASVYEPTNITINIPKTGHNNTTFVTNYFYTKLPEDLISGDNTISDVGIEVKASSPINLYIYDGQASLKQEGTLVFPERCANKEYLIDIFFGEGLREYRSSIVALEDNTKVEIKNQSNQLAYNETLNRFDVLVIASIDQSGTVVSADKNIQLFAGLPSAFIPFGNVSGIDNLFEQMPPLASLRRAYLLTFQAPRPHYSVRVVAPYDSTDVTFADVDGTTIKTVRLNASQNHLESFYNSDTISVTSTKDILVTQYAHGSESDNSTFGDPSYVVMSSVTQFINDYIIMVDRSLFDQNYVAIFIREEDDMSGLMVGNTSLPSDSSITALVPGVGKYRIVHKQIDSSASGPTPITITHTKSSVKFGLVQYGFDKKIGYALMAGRNVPDYTAEQ